MTNIDQEPATSRTAAATAARMKKSEEKAAAKLRLRGWVCGESAAAAALALRMLGWTCVPPIARQGRPRTERGA